MGKVSPSSPQPPRHKPVTTTHSRRKSLRVWKQFAVNIARHLFNKGIQILPGAASRRATIDKRSIEHMTSTSGKSSDKALTLLKASEYERDGRFIQASWLRSQVSEGIYEPPAGEWHRFRMLGNGGEGRADLAFKGLAGKMEVKKTFYEHTQNQSSEEIKLLERLDHPNIVKMFLRTQDNGEQEQGIHMKNGGAPLTKLVPSATKFTPISRRLFQSIARQLADSLVYLKEEKVLHRDIKPENIVIDPTGNITLIDFGMAYDCKTETPCHPDGVGTPCYMPPDTLNLMSSDIKYSDTADMFSAGQTLFELLTGTLLSFPPFRQWPDKSEADAWNHYRQDPETLAPLDTIGPTLAGAFRDESPVYVDALADLLKQMLHPDPDYRIPPEELQKHPLLSM